ncbi:MAG: hypothetical protein ACLRSW_07770 [Christensenellaceae bacterium]
MRKRIYEKRLKHRRFGYKIYGKNSFRPKTKAMREMKIEKFTLNFCMTVCLFLLCDLPEGEPKGIFQIVHGMCEYKERYDDFMRFRRTVL